MKTVIFFSNNRDITEDTIPYIMYGKYSHCGFIFIHDAGIEAFYTSPANVYRQFKDRSWNDDAFTFDFLLLSVDDEETRKLRSTCEACAKAKKPYNLLDVLLFHAPFRDPREISVFDAPTLNNTQAIITILRECLNRDNPLLQCLDGLHSRLTYMEVLYDRLTPHTLPVLWSNLSSFFNK
jgi:hypothetical protein